MIPVALTCPVWWVARWTVRMLTSLTVVVACSLGAAALSVDNAGPDWAAPAGVTSGSGEWTVAGADRATHGILRSAGSDSARAAGAGSGSTRPDVVVAVDSVPSAGLVLATPQPLEVVPAARHRALAGLTPATLGSRAPPVR